MVVVEFAAREEGRTDALDLDVSNTDATSVVKKAGGIGVLLWLDDLIEDAIKIGSRDVSGVAAIIA